MASGFNRVYLTYLANQFQSPGSWGLCRLTHLCSRGNSFSSVGMPTSFTQRGLLFFSFLLYLSILLKLKFTPVRDHFPKCSKTKIKWATGGKNEYPLIMIIKLSTLQQMLLEYLTSKGNYCGNLECCQIRPLQWQATYNEFTFGNKTLLGLWNFQRSHKDTEKATVVLNIVFWPGKITGVSLLFTACIKCEFLTSPLNTFVLRFLNINKVQLLGDILSNGAQNNTSQISVTGKIFVVWLV